MFNFFVVGASDTEAIPAKTDPEGLATLLNLSSSFCPFPRIFSWSESYLAIDFK
jgi:hypothetical protein